MRVYLAAPYETKPLQATRQAELHKHGIECTSNWLDEKEVYTCEGSHWVEIAKRDIHDIGQADTVVFDVEKESPRGGMHVEFGLAVAMGKRIILIGQPRSTFHYLATYICQSWEAAMPILNALRYEENN